MLGSEEESDLGEPGTEAELREATLATIASGVGNTSHSDYFFGDGDVDPPDFDFDTLSNISDGQVNYLLFSYFILKMKNCSTH